ncbi:MAG: molybdenum cofactor biosynthesis F family protein [Oscillospiraceae bacterium]|jgi:hypothetical protein|nr:molybdenum cofactor biosynthesis F family protein [Oscillospiraceae bacterium]
MFRTSYTALTGEQVAAIFAGAKPGAPQACCTSDALAGTRLSVVTDNGPKLEYAFADAKNLAVAIDGAAPVAAEYSALTLKSVVLFSHLIPGTKTGYSVIWDRKTDTVTVYEYWLDCAELKYPREVAREYYFGYAAKDGVAAPETRHALTNRLENKSIVWTEGDTRVLDIFNSTMYCSFIVLSDPESGIPVAAPSDYIKINEEIYIYSRMEAEFSGILTLEVIDLYSLTAIGVRFGINQCDKLEWRAYCAEGELAGQLATFSNFTDYGGATDFNKIGGPGTVFPEVRPKGRRAIYRVHGEYPDYTEEQARNSGQKPTSFPKAGQMLMPTGNSLPPSDFLAGKEFTLRMDGGFTVEYKIADHDSLQWRYPGEAAWHDETYRAFESGEDLIFFAHIQTGLEFGQAIKAAVDFSNGLVTILHSRQGNGHAWREVGFDVLFGVLEYEGVHPPELLRHTFTTDLVGKAFTWNYSDGPDGLTSMHTYSSPWGYSWTIFLGTQEGGMLWSSPCAYIKLRDDAYIMSWVEETSAGGQGTVLINTRTMHDAGFMYGAFDPFADPNVKSEPMVGLSSLGAYGRAAGTLDIMKYFVPKAK